MPSLLDRPLRIVLSAGFRLLKRRVRSRAGVHAIALTPDRRIVLVKLRYARGWRLPGGGSEEGEDMTDAALRELAEEIGMSSHGRTERKQVGRDPIVIVRDIAYSPPRWSWEVEAIAEAPLDRLPEGVAPIAARWLRALLNDL